MTISDATEAANFLRNKMRTDITVRDAISAYCQNHGHRDLFDWAVKDPPTVIQFAQIEQDMEPQFEQFEADLADVRSVVNFENPEE